MSAAGKRRGTAWENAVRDFLKPVFPECERAPRWGSVDKGDLVSTGPFTIECKARKDIDLAAAVTEATVENRNAGKLYPTAFIKRRNHPVSSAYVVMPAWAWRALAARALGVTVEG